MNDYQFVSALISEHISPDNIESLWVFGLGLSDANYPVFANVVLKDASLETLGDLSKLMIQLKKKGVVLQHFMDREYIHRTQDVYPVEYWLMQKRYTMLDGEDLISGMELDSDHIRLEVERELRGLQLHLRSEYALNSGNKKALFHLAERIRGALRLWLEATLLLAGGSLTQTFLDSLGQLSTYLKPLGSIQKLYAEDIPKKVDLLQNLVKGVSTELDSIIDWIDQKEN